MALQVAVLMDPISAIKIHKDSTFAMLLEAQRRGHVLLYMELGDMWLEQGEPFARLRKVSVRDDPNGWYTLGEAATGPLSEVDFLLMRKDPPFDMEYVHSTYMLERAETAGTPVFNQPRALRDCNEKLFTAWFPELCPPTLVSRNAERLRAFAAEHNEIVLKPLGGMGGASVFRTHRGDPNLNVIMETLTANGSHFAMAQRYLHAITEGDKRILVIDGEPVPYALARLPAEGDFRGNLASGGTGRGVELTARDREIAEAVGPELRRRGILFAGLDVIGEYLTEINVTSPTCIRELDKAFDLNIAGQLFDVLEARLEAG